MHENMSLLSDLYGAEYSRIDSLCVCRQEKEHLHDILNIMTRSMSKAKQADVPAIYPLKCEHKKSEHVKPEEVKGKADEQDLPIQTEPLKFLKCMNIFLNKEKQKSTKYQSRMSR